MIIERFLTYIRAEKRYSDHTVQGYGRDIRRFVADLGLDQETFDPSLVTSEDIRWWIMSLSEKGLSATSVNRMTSSLRAMFRWLRKTGIVVKDPFLRVSYLRTPSKLPGYVTESTMGNMVAVAERQMEGDDLRSARNALIILLFYSTGIRLAELIDIRLRDFTPDFSEVRIRGKGDKERIVPVIPYTRTKISEYLARIKQENICMRPDNYLFLSSKGNHISRSEVYRVVNGEMTKAGIQGKRSPHVLRHTFATHMLNDGADIREIQELLGHSSLTATQVYTHNSITKLKEIYKGAHPRGNGKEEKE